MAQLKGMTTQRNLKESSLELEGILLHIALVLTIRSLSHKKIKINHINQSVLLNYLNKLVFKSKGSTYLKGSQRIGTRFSKLITI